ncbi:MAG TPA: SDR family oxidoreductase [Polyangiaceae bacterium]|nr:SDR family oxidoreductase [Polyangiaceae bacterium]
MALDGDAEAKWFLVSGGSGGIGSAICEDLASCGYKPLVGYHRNREAAIAVAERTGGVPLPLDLSQDESIESALQTLGELPRLYGVVLAGSPPLCPVPFGKISHEHMFEQWQVNVVGPQKLLASLVKHCFRKHKAGCVVGILTQAMGDDEKPVASGMGAYVIAKYGMQGMLALLAADYPWLSVRSVSPGYTETRMLEAFDPRFLELQRSRIAFHTPQEIAAQVLAEVIQP